MGKRKCGAGREAPDGGKKLAGRPRLDFAGRRFGHWLVLSPAAWDERGATAWLCRCACGAEQVVPHNDLGQRRTFSCGCISRGHPATADQVRRMGQIVAARRGGETLAAIAARHHISRQRVHQILRAAQQAELVTCRRP